MTLFTSDNSFRSDTNLKKALQKILNGLLITIGCATFGAIYEHFSHGVYSYYMIYAFALPLLLYVLPNILLLFFGKREIPEYSRLLWNFGLTTLTVGCIMQGVLVIYGTGNRLMLLYPVLGGMLMTAGVVVWIVRLRRKTC
mgnify:CR=1 FL=1